MKELLFTLSKPEMAEVYSRYSAKAPEPLSAQFNDYIDKQSAVKAYCCFVLIFASHNSPHKVTEEGHTFYLNIGLKRQTS